MIVLDESTKRLLHQLQDQNGKIMIVDSMPDDLKRAIETINEQNINFDVGYEPEVINEDDDTEVLSDEYSNQVNESSVQSNSIIDDIVEDDSLTQDSITDLNNIF